jgi:hypothetical protein
MHTVRYFDGKTYEWVGLSRQPSIMGKVCSLKNTLTDQWMPCLMIQLQFLMSTSVVFRQWVTKTMYLSLVRFLRSPFVFQTLLRLNNVLSYDRLWRVIPWNIAVSKLLRKSELLWLPVCEIPGSMQGNPSGADMLRCSNLSFVIIDPWSSLIIYLMHANYLCIYLLLAPHVTCE